MIKHLKMFSLSLTVAAMLAGASQVGAQSVPAYYTTFYSDATYQTEVGYLTPECRVLPYIYVQYYLTGTYTRYSLDQYAFSCGEYGPEVASLFKGMDMIWEPYGSSADSLARMAEAGMPLRPAGKAERPTAQHVPFSKPRVLNKN